MIEEVLTLDLGLLFQAIITDAFEAGLAVPSDGLLLHNSQKPIQVAGKHYQNEPRS